MKTKPNSLHLSSASHSFGHENPIMKSLHALVIVMLLAGVRPSSAQVQTETIDFFTTNVVSVQLGQEGIDDGIKHLSKQGDGRTNIEALDGVPCRLLNRKPEGKTFGYLYFFIHPDFKERELKTARIEVEYFVTNSAFLRLQYDGLNGDVTKPYKTALAQSGEVAKLGNTAAFTRIQGSNAWKIATFYIADGVFRNSQNGRADFRLEVTPPEIYVRRVTVTREEIQSSPPLPRP